MITVINFKAQQLEISYLLNKNRNLEECDKTKVILKYCSLKNATTDNSKNNI
jgi:hypothetical protein